MPGALAFGGAEDAENIPPLCSLIVECAGAGSAPRPASCDLVLLPVPLYRCAKCAPYGRMSKRPRPSTDPPRVTAAASASSITGVICWPKRPGHSAISSASGVRTSASTGGKRSGGASRPGAVTKALPKHSQNTPVGLRPRRPPHLAPKPTLPRTSGG